MMIDDRKLTKDFRKSTMDNGKIIFDNGNLHYALEKSHWRIKTKIEIYIFLNHNGKYTMNSKIIEN